MAPAPLNSHPAPDRLLSAREAADFAHDLNNLLLALTSCLELIRHRSGEAQIKDYAARGLDALDRGTALIDRLTPTAPDRGAAVDAAVPEGDAPPAPTTILIIDDDDDVRQILAELLQSLGHRTIEAADGPTGVRMMDQASGIDLAIIDYALPGRNGGDIAGDLLALQPALPILIATGHGGTDALDARWRHLPILRKPFHIAELSETVAALLKSARIS
jgi:CheY-like chemotaxis protein